MRFIPTEYADDCNFARERTFHPGKRTCRPSRALLSISSSLWGLGQLLHVLRMEYGYLVWGHSIRMVALRTIAISNAADEPWSPCRPDPADILKFWMPKMVDSTGISV